MEKKKDSRTPYGDLASGAATETSNLVRNGANDGESDIDKLFNYDSDTDERRASSSSERMFMEDTTTWVVCLWWLASVSGIVDKISKLQIIFYDLLD